MTPRTSARQSKGTSPMATASSSPGCAYSPGPGLLDATDAGAAQSDATATLVTVHDRMVAEGLFHLLVPPELGGSGASIIDWFDAAVAIAAADPSAGWLFAQGAVQTAWIAVAGSDALVDTFFATLQTLASTAAGDVAAEDRGDRYRLRNARWAYASGSTGAAFLGGMIRTTGPDSKPQTRMALLPAGRVTVEPTWDTLGLRGTASNHIDFGTEVDVPATFTFTWPQLTVARPSQLALAMQYALPMISLSAAATNLGAARRSIQAATVAATDKQHRFDTVPAVQQPSFLRGLADLHGSVDLATSGLRALLSQVWDRAGAGTGPDAETRARLRLAAARAVDLGADVVRGAQHLVGADALHRCTVLERLGRDSQMLLPHVTVSPSTRQQLAQVLLGTYSGPPGLV